MRASAPEPFEKVMTNETVSTAPETAAHEHQHTRNRFAVIPTHIRLDADAGYTGRGVSIAFLDSGFHPHPDLTAPVNRIIAFQDISGEEATLEPNRPAQAWQWHGTQTAVVAAGNGLLSDGVYRGVATDAQLVLVKVGLRGRITEENIARGFRWVIENRERYNIRVVNVSLGGDEDVPCSQSIIDMAAEEAVRRGIVVVAAAGNSGDRERPHSIPPANSPSVITVGGYDDGNSLEDRQFDLYHSNYGPTADGTVKPEIIAPAMWVAAPVLPGTDLYRMAEGLSQVASAPDYQLRGILRQVWREADLPESLLEAEPGTIRAAVETLLSRNKIVATHYQHVDGTSFAAPIVSSVVAQMIEANPQLSPAAIKNILVSAADRIAGAPVLRQGYGVLNARRALRMARREKHVLQHAHFCPPRIEAGRLVFFYHDDSARRVSLAGDFNDWDATTTPFTKETSGIWRAEITPPPAAGSYRYKFIVDGFRWVEDPNNGVKEPDQFGGFNSILNIR
jgi:serine protease AprX